MNRTVTRADLVSLLTRWQRGELSASEVHAWAEVRYLPGDTAFDDEDEDEDYGSAAAEVLARLDMLDQHLILPEDVPLYLELLRSPRGELAAAMERFEAEHGQIDFGARVIALRCIAPYARYLGGNGSSA